MASSLPRAHDHSVANVIFVTLYNGDSFCARLAHVAGHLNATGSATHTVRMHALVQRNTPSVPAWITQHEISAMPSDAIAQHKNLTKGKPHGAHVFLWKAFLYRLLPLDKVIVLDLDVVLASGARLHGLWSHFDSFGPREVFGMVPEQSPTYARVRNVGPGDAANGGVQLHHLARMRATARSSATDEEAAGSWDAVLRRCAAGGCSSWDAVEPSLGDQTLYTHMCRGQAHLCHRLPCGWNRQLSTRFYTAKDFTQKWHACTSRCRLLHFNQPLLEALVPVLQPPGRTVSCAECRNALAGLENKTKASGSRNPKFTWGASKQYMARVVEECCCAPASARKRSNESAPSTTTFVEASSR